MVVGGGWGVAVKRAGRLERSIRSCGECTCRDEGEWKEEASGSKRASKCRRRVGSDKWIGGRAVSGMEEGRVEQGE